MEGRVGESKGRVRKWREGNGRGKRKESRETEESQWLICNRNCRGHRKSPPWVMYPPFMMGDKFQTCEKSPPSYSSNAYNGGEISCIRKVSPTIKTSDVSPRRRPFVWGTYEMVREVFPYNGIYIKVNVPYLYILIYCIHTRLVICIN